MPAAEQVPAPPAVPGYVLEERLGRGGSGEVWRAAPRRGGPPVAVKVLVEGDPQGQAREAALLGELDHPHLVRLLEVVHQPRRGGAARVALVLELLEGGSLADLLARRGRLRPGEVVTAFAPVAAALAHTHAHGVVHGDLSPGNVVFTGEGRPVLTDLGVARVIGETAAAAVTPAYVDPTVARGGAPGPASDVFGVAAAAFHALTGIAPWNAATPADILAVAAHGWLPDLAELAPEAPPELLRVVERGLSADPHTRGSAAAFALDLRHACRPEPVELSATGRSGGRPDPRTELTHVVPGRRPRPAPVVVERRSPAGRWWDALGDLRSRVPRRAATAVAVLAVLVATGWLGLRWADGGQRPPGPAAASVAAATSPAPADAAESPGAPAEPVTAADWTALLTELYARRVEAFSTATAEPLDLVWAPGAPQRTEDEQLVAALAGAGQVLDGFRPRVGAVAVASLDPQRAELRFRDGWPAYEVVAADGAVVRAGAGRPDADVAAVVVRTPQGWRIESVTRTG
ncbi:serine/threonine-protein kinase [Blastococcus sp. TF02A-30]|uniref:serine/threonine-protein kinase n=1 Tax=Blastococcus sp. TF02A-30 TaxID=2250580 RepID=UPI000DEA64E6|nr:serine/threonine-protein kinase [Blastococcus sp. TF02A-30]RBY85495.1 serine/threonine protein kinase [Blastococcus sp. TF02A-30]